MRIESNVSAVAQRVTRLINRDIPLAMQNTLKPALWREPARQEAQRTLEALAEAKDRHFIPDFIRTLQADVFGRGFFLRMRSPFLGVQTLADYQAAKGVVTPADRGLSLFQKDVTAFEELMQDWVREEKHKDQRDAGKSDEEIAMFLSYIMLTPNPTARELAARAKLMPHIVDFLQRKQAEARLAAPLVDTWLRAVLCAWRNLVGRLFPELFREQLKAARGELPLGNQKI
jgi:hypothetical protein